MGGARNMYGGEEMRIRGFGEEVWRKKIHFVDPDIDGMIILRWIFRKWDVGGGMDWIELAQERDRWRALVNAVMNLRVP
jgi:hypothetical protein